MSVPAASPSCSGYRSVMDVHWWATALVASLGLAGLAFSIRAIAMSRDSRWLRFYPRYERRVDQRWSIPIAIFVDTVFAAIGLGDHADKTYWISWALVVALQVLFIASVLSLTWLRHRSMHRASGRTTPPLA
jgi:hypothetical protein